MSATDQALQNGATFQGRYEIIGEIGAGSFGRVYRARQLSTGQDVAIKVVGVGRPGEKPSRDQRMDRFRREMRLCVELYHPNIVRLVDSGETEDGTVYAAFEYVPGSTLKDLLVEERKLTFAETVHLMSQILDALSCAHARGVVHRDLKPENIIVMRTGIRRNAMVLDFGLGGFAPEANGWGMPRITATQEMMGTPCYAAPEQLRGEPPTTRSDLYSWGLIFIECLTGELAVRGASVHEAILKQLNDEPIPIPAELPDERLRKVLETVTAKPVEKRDVTIEGLMHALSAVQARQPPIEAPGAEPPRTAPGERRQVTVVSCRLSVPQRDGYRVDLEQLDELLHAQHALYAELAASGGGRVAGAFGDRTILVFGYPHAREDDARHAARTALGIAAEVARRSAQSQSEGGFGLQLRIGIHTGVVIARELRRPAAPDAFDLVGPTPQIATRLEELAAPGEVLASADTQRLLRGDVEREPAGPLNIPELGAEVPVFRLTGLRQATAGLETIQLERETRLVGRGKQLGQLLAMWRQVQAGRSAIVLVTGEPGIGKSRLIRELRRQVPAQAWLALQCAAENQNSPLRPIVDLLSSGEQPIETLLQRYAMSAEEHLPLFAQLLGQPGGERWPSVPLTPERRKEATLNALLTLLTRMAAETPLVFALEDLHWADPTTLELVKMLIEEVGASGVAEGADAAPLCVVLSARPQFAPAWSMENVSLLPLPHLARAEVEEMVRSSPAADLSALPRRVIDEVILRSDGIPLFIEEVTRVLIESGGGQGNDGEVEIPGSLRDLITARLDGVSGSAKETAQVASVLGREFRYEFLRAVSFKPESLVRSDVRDLVNAGLLFRRRSARSESYLFKHALLRDTAYESMMRASRQVLHERVANTLRERFPEVERNQPEILALHFGRGGQGNRALEYWRRAGELAVRRGAYVESIRHFQEGLGLLEKMPPSRALGETELELRTALGVGLIATKGYGAEEVERNCSRAQQLCLDLGDAPQLVPVLYGLCGYHLLRDHRDALDLAARLQQAARSDEHLLIATAMRGITTYFGGELAAAISHLERASELYSIEHQRSLARSVGEEAALLAPLYSMWCRFHLGRLDQAIAQQKKAEALAEEIGSPYVTATYMVFAMLLGLSMEDAAMTRHFAEKTIAISMEQRFPFFLATATCGQGWTRIVAGDVEAGIAQIEKGLEILGLTGAVVARSFWLACIAEGQLRQGDVAAGLSTVGQALALSEGNLNRLQDPWLHRVKGELLLLSSDPAGAEQSLRTAAKISRASGDRPFELRAVMSLARLLRSQNNAAAARPLLAGVLESFDEGFATKDLREGRELLDELA